MFQAIKQFFLGKPAPESQAPYKVPEPAATAPIPAEVTPPVAESVKAEAVEPRAKRGPAKPRAKKTVTK